MGVGENLAGDCGRPKDIEVMDLAEQILHFLEVVAPGVMLDWEKIFHDVAEALNADAQTVERGPGAVSQSAVVEFAGLGPALQGEIFEEGAARSKADGARGKRFAPVAPLFAIELGERGLGFALLDLLATVEDIEQRLGCTIAGVVLRMIRVWDGLIVLLRRKRRGRVARIHMGFGGMKFLDPLHHYVDIAQGAEPLKEATASLFHGLPVGIGIEGPQAIGQGATAAQSDAEVVDRVGTEIGGDVIALLK